MTRNSHRDLCSAQLPASLCEKPFTPASTPPKDIEILRRAGVRAVTGVFAPTASALLSTLNKHGYLCDRKSWLVSDLLLGAWRPHQVARDYLSQLGCDKTEWNSPSSETMFQILNLDNRDKDTGALGKIIDAECSGDTKVIKALTLARRVIAEADSLLSCLFLIFMPRSGLAWRAENLAFIDFLIQGLEESSHRLILVAAAEECSPTPAHWQLDWLLTTPSPEPSGRSAQRAGPLGLIPGVIEPEVAYSLTPIDQQTSYLELSQGYLLVDPGCRRTLSSGLRLEYDKIGALKTLPTHYRTIAQLHGDNYYCEPHLLSREAWRLSSEGGTDIAMELMKRAVACARSREQKAGFLLDLQGMRIASQQFEEAAEVPAPDEALPDEIRGALLQMKGWALAILGRAEAAKAALAAARALLTPALSGTKRFLYLNNIYALSLLKAGHTDEALRLEKEIEAELERYTVDEGSRDWTLTYVNAINQARLYRIIGDVEHSLSYYQRSFDTALGARSESDSVYVNVCLGRLFGEHGRSREAFNCWMRAGLHWASAQIPEGLARRVSMSILHRPVRPGEHVEEEIASALYRAILEAASAAGIHPTNLPSTDAPVFSKGLPLDRNWRHGALVVGRDGWSIVASPLISRAAYDGPQNKLLRALLFSIIRATAPRVAWHEIHSVFIEDPFGLELPATLHQVVSMAVRLCLEKIIYNDSRLEISALRQKQLEMGLSVGLGLAVAEIRHTGAEQVQVTFKRYLAPAVIFGLDAQLLSHLEARPSIAELIAAFPDAGRETVVACVRRLERARILKVDLSEESLLSEIYDSEALSWAHKNGSRSESDSNQDVESGLADVKMEFR